MKPDDSALPHLRPDLELFEQPADISGRAVAMVYDPLRHAYFRIAGEALALLSRWDSATRSDLRSRMKRECNKTVSDDDIARFQSFLETNALLVNAQDSSRKYHAQYRNSRRRSLGANVLHGYIFFRIPLLRPLRFLRAVTPFFGFAFHRAFWWAVAATGVAGAYLVSREWDLFLATAAGQLDPSGLFLIGVTLLLLKSIHEFGHAVAATRYGCKVSTMGVAFMLLAPILYTDTTDAWRLSDTRARLQITIAGVAAEAVVAALALLMWAFLPDGPARSFAFMLAITAPIATLLINLNPFMRFDGYFYLMDRWRVENLQERSFALARWRLREFLFDIQDAPPEIFESAMRAKLIAYAWATWVYRLFLFLGIAFLVYALFAKVFGIVLFVVEIAYFIALPMLREFKVWWERRGEIAKRKRGWATLAILVCVLAILVVPWRGREHVPAVLVRANDTPLHVRLPGRILRNEALYSGARVVRGQTLLVLESPDLKMQMQQALLRERLLVLRLTRIAGDPVDRSQRTVLESDLAAAKEAIAGLRRLEAERVVRAPFDGLLVDVDPHIHSGRWLRPADRIGRVVDEAGWMVRGLASEMAAVRCAPGADGRFVPDDASRASIGIRLQQIASSNERTIVFPSLAVANGGWVAARESGKGELTPLAAVFAAEFAITNGSQSNLDAATQSVIRGVAIVDSAPESILYSVWRQVARVLVRESGF